MSATTFASDLRATREARGISLEQIQNATRIPVDVLKRFEDGRLLDDPTYNVVYVRAFLKSYAGAVGLSADDVIGAYDSARSGQYAGRLHPDYDGPLEAAPAPEATPPPVVTPAGAPEAAPSDGRPAPPPPAPPPAVTALRASPEAAARSAPSSGAPVQPKRVARPAVPGARRSFDKNWGTILALFAGFVVLLGAALWYLVIRDETPPADDAPRAADGSIVAVDTSGAGIAAGAGPRLQLPIVVSVSAADGSLSPFRVTADVDARRPFWIEQGATRSFQADSLLVLWGEGDDVAFADAMLEFQGLRWRPADGRPVRITPARGQALLDSLARAQP